MSNSSLLATLKKFYTAAQQQNFHWRPLYPNNMPCNGQWGIFMDINLKDEESDRYHYCRYTIQYQPRCDANGISHPEEGTAFYLLYRFMLHNLPEPFIIPAPSDDYDCESNHIYSVNDFGEFRYAFDDEEIAKQVVSADIKQRIYPYLHILSQEELDEWNEFVKSFQES